MRRGRTTSFKGKDWQRLPYFGLNLCSTQSRAGRTPPPREARNVRMLTAPTPGRPTLKSTFLIHRPICRVRPVAHPPEAATRLGRQGRRPFRVARARPIHRPFWEVHPRRASPAPLMRRYARGRRFLWNRAIRSRPIAVHRWRRTARLCEPQKLGQRRGPAQRENRSRFSRPKNKQSPKPSPVLRPVSASLRLRFRSAAFPRALRDSFSFGLSPKELNRFFRRGAR